MVLEKLKKKIFGEKSEEQERYGFPYRWFRIGWGRSARQHQVGGDRNKELTVMEQGRPKRKFPYAHGIIEKNMKEEMKTPSLDETGGHKAPTYDVLSEYLPAKISNRYNNLDLQ